MKGIGSGLIVAVCLTACAPALATGLDFTVGPSMTSSGRTTGAAFISAFRDSPPDGHAHFDPIGTIGWVDSRRTRVDDLHHPVFLAAGGVRIVAANRHWFVGEQLAVTSARTDALSSRFEFMTSAGWQDGHFVVMLRHVSNGHILGGGKNLGETMLLGGVDF
ncbi:MAG TPA: hypothetical protein VFW60_06035 [Rhodanobacteraceae bacterium]|nr:hypothetical protein [Rhodanobacteraceae bacterium]